MPIFEGKWESEHPIFEGSGSQGTLFEESARKWESEHPYFPQGSGESGCPKRRVKTYVQGNQPP